MKKTKKAAPVKFDPNGTRRKATVLAGQIMDLLEASHATEDQRWAALKIVVTLNNACSYARMDAKHAE